MSVERQRPRAHLVIDDFFEKAALDEIFAEIQSLEGGMKPGLVREIGHDGQSVFFAHKRRQNKAIWIHDPSTTLDLFRERFWSPSLIELFREAREPLYQILPNCFAPHLQVSTYMTGDHYDFHEDEGAGVNVTAIVFLAAAPEKVHGGDLVLAYRGEQSTVRFRHNRLVIFPSRTIHRVTRVRVDSNDPNHARISLQCWLSYGSLDSKPKPRAPEADRPTFLLAEPSIIAAAQALAGTHPKDQTPEDLYWGALYLTRILTSNLRCLADAQDGLTLGPIRIRRREELEVFSRGRVKDAHLRIGFRLRASPYETAKALTLFVEIGRGEGKSEASGVVRPGMTEKQTGALLRKLIAKSNIL